MKINPEVLKAIQEGKPVVALESTIFLMECHIQEMSNVLWL